jgi:2-succinyl-5-enolpyruvyl-6-hydroxy-3-cyclohexene-1-carboxylate synthase
MILNTTSFRQSYGQNHLWSLILLEEFRRQGVSHIVLSPGARSAPLAVSAFQLAMEFKDTLHLHIHPDERGSAFFALGLSKATEKPPILICTSGTAVANYLPAVIEAAQSGLPLIIMSADRPFDLRESGANQTILQPNIFGTYVKYVSDLPPPNRDTPLGNILAIAGYAYQKATSSPQMPVHLNLQFRAPLLEAPQPLSLPHNSNAIHSWLQSNTPRLNRITPTPTFDNNDLVQIKNIIAESKRLCIIAGNLHCNKLRQQVINLASFLKAPLLADITSSIRGYKDQVIISHYDLILSCEGKFAETSPDLILHFGDLPTSNTLNDYVNLAATKVIQFRQDHKRCDPNGMVTHYVDGDIRGVINELLTGEEKSTSEILPIFLQHDKACLEFIEKFFLSTTNLNELNLFHTVNKLIPKNGKLYLGNSLSIRHGDLLLNFNYKEVTIFSHRGASGIDGTIALAAGVNRGLKEHLTVIMGDLTFFHDLPSLKFFRDLEGPATIIILNNDGGAIFNTVNSLKNVDGFERLFITPHGLNFNHIAKGFNLKYTLVKSVPDFEEAYLASLAHDRASIIEVETNGNETTSLLNQLKDECSAIF